MTQWQFDAETAVAATGPGRWRTRLSSAWNIGDNPNGGYAAAAPLRAMRQAAEMPDPVSVTIHYLRPGLAGQDASIVTELVRKGRRAANVTASMQQDGKERIRVMGVMADLDDAASDTAQTTLSLPVPELPEPDQCLTRTALGQGVELPITSRVDVRVAPAPARPRAADRAEMAGWLRFADGRPVDSAALVLFADAFPPSLYSLMGAVGWVPTLELTVHVRRRPAPGWIAARFHTRDLADGMMVEDGELWDETGSLVARSRQLALLLEG